MCGEVQVDLKKKERYGRRKKKRELLRSVKFFAN